MPFAAYIGIGSNQPHGDRTPEQLAAAAMYDLEKLGDISARSALYATQPVGPAHQPTFINAAVELQTLLDPEDLLQALIQIERKHGRDRATGVPKGPRTLDLDLLLVASAEGQGMIQNSESLTLPHPEISRRRFVLAPLAEIAPGLEHPVLKKTIAELLAELPDEGPNSVAAVSVLETLSEKAK